MSEHSVGDMAVHWFPQVPCKPFVTPVGSADEGRWLMDVLAAYDEFQFEHRIKPDYCNAGVLSVWVADCDGYGTPGWEDWDEEADDDDGSRWNDDADGQALASVYGANDE